MQPAELLHQLCDRLKGSAATALHRRHHRLCALPPASDEGRGVSSSPFSFERAALSSGIQSHGG